jgi:hypothetical protein
MRLSKLGLTPLERAAALPSPEDFDPDLASTAKAEEAEIFGDLIGCQAVLGKLREWQATISAAQALGRDPLDSFELNFLFVGSPGKTYAPGLVALCLPGYKVHFLVQHMSA